MRLSIIIVLLFFFGKIQAQRLNNFGHFESQNPLLSAIESNNIIKEIPDRNLQAGENSVLLINNGFIILTGGCDRSPVTMRIISKTKKLLFENTFHQMINFELSQDKSFCIFNDKNEIRVINLLNFKSNTYAGSNIFSVSNTGDIVYFNSENSSVFLNDKSYPVNEIIYKIIFFKETPMFITKKDIYKISEDHIEIVYTAKEGRIFDIGQFNDELYISTKTEFPDRFIFKSFSTGDLVSFDFKEEVVYHLNRLRNSSQNTRTTSLSSGLVGELIRNPLDFYNDTVYQPIGNSYGEIQDYSGSPYLHPGVDLLGYYHQDVHSVKKGYVKAILTTVSTAHWRIAIANENTSNQTSGYLYAHIDSTTFPFAVGDSVEEGDVIGQLVDFGVVNFNHCHFARITDQGTVWSGNWWTYDNPLCFMTNFFDTVAPVFEKTIFNDAFAFRNSNGVYLSPDSLYGQVKIISKIYDLINSTWQVEVNKIRYNLSPLAWPQTILLDTFSVEFDFFNDQYAGGTYFENVLNTIYSRDSTCFSIGNYNQRSFYHMVSNSDGNDTIDGMDSLQLFNTLNYQDGSYILRVFASDPSGNTSVDTMIIRIKNSISGINYLEEMNKLQVTPNPSFNGIFSIKIDSPDKNYYYELFDEYGRKIESGNFSQNSNVHDLEINQKGVYFLRIYNKENVVIKKLISR